MEKMKHTSKLAALAPKLPVGRSERDKELRREMFNGIDKNGSGQIPLAEVKRPENKIVFIHIFFTQNIYFAIFLFHF